MRDTRFQKIVKTYQNEVLRFQSDYSTPELQAAANDYPAFRLPYRSGYYDEANKLTDTQFAWICDNLILYDFVLEGNNYNFSLLQKQTTLRILSITDLLLEDISWISPLTELINLDLINTDIVDISALANCKKLMLLSLSGNKIKDISPIAACHKLNYLDLSHNHIENLAPLANLKNIERLYISLNNTISLAPLATLPNIRYLEILTHESISLAPLSQLRSLIELTIQGGNLNDSCNFPLIPNLRHLNISYNNLTKLPPLPPLLEYINCQNNQITDISPLAKLNHLEECFVSQNPVTTAPPPCLLTQILRDDSHSSYDYDESNKTLPSNAQEIWTLLMTDDPTNRELAKQLMTGLDWTQADTDAYIFMSEKIKE
jgi:hypothetical protein